MSKTILSIAVMACISYFIRFLPLALIKGKITSPFIKSFLYYIPYTVLAAMAFPAILFCTPSIISAIIGLAVALILAFCGRGLMTVAMFSVIAVILTELIL